MLQTEDVTDQILIALRKIIRAIDLQSKALVQKCGLTGPQLVVLKELSRNGEMSAGSLAEKISLSQATVTGVTDRLMQRALIRKTRDAIDRRRVLLSCTLEGRKLSESAPSVLQERFSQNLSSLARWEQFLILSSLEHISSMMEADSLSAEPILASGPILVTPEVTRDFLEPNHEAAEAERPEQN